MKAKFMTCQRCDTPFIETEKEAERRRLMDAKLLCEDCQDVIKKEAIRRGIGPLYYASSTEPVMV